MQNYWWLQQKFWNRNFLYTKRLDPTLLCHPANVKKKYIFRKLNLER
jgi:hypothetical protein